MGSYFSRPQQSISALTYRPWASRAILSNNISQLGNRIGLGAHSHIVESLYRDGIVKRPDLNLTDIKETDISRFVTKKQLDLYPDLTSLIISESDFEANENLKKLNIPDIGKKIVSHLKESSIIDANGRVDKQKAESLNISENSDLVKKFDYQLSNEQIQILIEGIKQVLNGYIIENPFDYGNKTLNVALNRTINALSWIKSAGGSLGWNILKYSGYGAAFILAAAGLAGICATLLTLPSPIGVGTGLYLAGKTSKFVANKIDPNLSFLGYKVAPLLNWASRILPILGIIIGGIGLGSELFSSEFKFFDELKDMEIFLASGMSYIIGKYFLDVAKNIKELKASYGGQLDPGKLGRMKKEMYAAVSSVTFDKIYLGVRFLLLAVSSIFVGASIGLWPMLGMATFPVAGIAATVYLRNSEWFATKANVLDWINSPVLKRLINIDDSLRAITLSDISSNIPQIKNFLGKFFDPSSKLKISESDDAKKFLKIINSTTNNRAINKKINKTKTMTLGDLEEVLKDEVMQDALKKDIDLFKVFEGSSTLFFKQGLNKEKIKDELNEIFKKEEEKDKKLIVENRLIQKFNAVNQKIKDQLMVYAPLYGFKAGLYASAFISGGLLLALATAKALPISKSFGSFATNLIFEKESDTAVKAIASIAFRLAPIVGMGLLLSSGMGIGLAGLAAYGALMGSIACFASELHGVGHSINSSEGFKVSLKSSSKDLVGENYIREKIKKVSTLLLNPHTGTFEHTIGIIFTMLFNTVNPNISMVCALDKVPFGSDLSLIHSEKEAINFVENLRKHVFYLLQRGIFGEKDLSIQYLILAKNLKDVASWYRGELSKQLREKYHTELKDKKRVLKTVIEEILKNKKEENIEKIMADLFENPEEEILVLKPDWEKNCSDEELKKQIKNTTVNFDSFTEDAFRVAMEQLEITASEFEQKANQLEQKVQKGLISEQDFDNELDILRCFDSDLIEIHTVSRKELSGDERMVRKVENVATLPIFRGLTVYKFWKTSSSENYPIVDWVAGTWTRVRNPKFKYGAKSGLEAAKYIWIKRDHILTEVQREYEESLSTSDIIAKVDNDPSKDERFKSDSEIISVTVNGTVITLKEGDYYYHKEAEKDQKATPKVSKIIGRDNTEFYFKEKRTLPDGSINIEGNSAEIFKGIKMTGESFINIPDAPIGTISKDGLIVDMKNKNFSEESINLVVSALDKIFDKVRGMDGIYRYKPSPDNFKTALNEITDDENLRNYLQTIYEMLQISPSVMTFDAFDYQTMMDKNDIELKTHLLLPALLEREKESSKIIDIIYKYNRPNTTYTFEKTEIPDGAQISDIEVVDANIELSYVDKDGKERIIPFKIDRSAIITWKKDGSQGKDPNKQSLSGAEIETDNEGNVIRFSLLYNGGEKKVDLELNAKPKYLKHLFKDGNIPNGETITFKLNAFFDDPFREGDMPWLKVTYKENEAAKVEQVKFIRCWEQARPMLFKKKGLHKPTKKGNNEFDFGYFTVSIKDGTLIIDNVRLPRGKPVKLVSACAKKLKEGDKITKVDNSGDIYLVNGRFTPIKPNDSTKNLKGNIIGIVEGGKYDGKFVDLGKSLAKLSSEQIDGIIEITPTTNGKLEVVSRRLDAKGLPVDSSAYIYNLTEEATKRLQSVIPDLSWIDQSKIEIKSDKVILHYKVPGKEQDQTFELSTDDMFDNFNVAFLKNEEMKVNNVESIYTGKNKTFRPSLDFINGNLRLIVHKVDRWQINHPEELKNETDFTITPTKATSAVKINGEWIPLNIDQPIINEDEIDYDLSQVFDGQIHSAIGPQTRFGNWGDFSLQYPRDPYFYGLPIATNFEIINEYGENFGLNRAKALRAYRGIQSGRTHTMPYTFFHNLMFADIMETNSEYYKKLSNYGHWLTGVGVSEDTQMEMVLWLLGMKMHVVKDMLTIMAGEKTFDKYKIQNTTRYNYSEALFVEPFKLALWDIIYGIFPSRDPFYFASPEAMSELAAGRTWYKYPWAKSIELSAIPTYLISRGFVPFYPVDMALFMTSWSLRTFFDMWNYKQQMNSIGYGLIETGLFENPAKEIGFIKAYNDAAWTQWLQRYQYATFALTSSGGAGMVPQEFKDLVNTFFGATAGAEVFALSSLFLTTFLENFAANPTLYSSIQNAFGIGLGPAINIAFGLFMTAVLQKARKNLIVEGLPPKPQVTLRRAFKITVEDLSKIIVTKTEKIKDTIREKTGFKVGSASAEKNLKRAKKVIEELKRAGILSESVKNYKNEPETYSLMIYDTDEIKTKVENALKNALSEREINSVVNFLTNLAKQQKEKYDKYYEELNKITSKIKDNSSYSELFDARDKLFNILRGLDCVDKKGRISFGMQNKWRDQANEILEIMALIEMRICINAINDIKNNKLPSHALSALKRVMATTQEYLIIEAAAKMYRLITTGKDKPKVEPKPIPKNEITNEGAKK